MAKTGRIGLLLGAAGLTGVLVALGYIVRVAQGDLLGVSTYDPDRAGYFLAAGDLIIHTLLSLLDWPALIALIVGLALICAIELTRVWRPQFQDARSLIALGVGSLCAAHLFFFALPTIPINNLLFQSICPDRHFEVSKAYELRTEEVWKQVLCSRVSSATLPECGTRSPQKYRRDLELTFTIAVLTAGLLWVVGWRIFCFKPIRSETRLTWWSIVPWDWSRTVLATLLFLMLFGLAYQYGKTAKSTLFPVAQVEFEQITNPSLSEPSPVRQQPSDFLLVSDNGTNSILYNIDPTNERVWVVRDTAIKLERISSLEDILKRRIGLNRNSCANEVQGQ